ncbi:MAG: hypothetical protein AAF666_04835 [Pseudomonadota bacterium]
MKLIDWIMRQPPAVGFGGRGSGAVEVADGPSIPADTALIDTRAAVAAKSLSDPVITHLRTSGYAATGDGGAAAYRRVTAEPVHAGKVQSLDGSWWELDPDTPGATVQMFGGVSAGTGDDTAAWQDYIDWSDLHGSRTYLVTGTTRITDQLNCRNGVFAVQSSGARTFGKIITATTITRAQGCVLAACRGAFGVTFEPEQPWLEDLFADTFLCKIIQCEAIGYNALVSAQDDQGQITLVEISDCNLFNTRHAFLTDGLEGGNPASVNEFHFTDNYCHGGSNGVADPAAVPDHYHRFAENLDFDPSHAFIRGGVFRSCTIRDNTFERMHHVSHVASFDNASISDNYYEAVDIDHTWDAPPAEGAMRPVVLGNYAQENNCFYRAFRAHRDPTTPGRVADLTLLLGDISSGFFRSDTITDGTNTAEVVLYVQAAGVLEVRGATGPLSGTITGSASGATATIRGSLSLNDVLTPFVEDMRTERFDVSQITTGRLVAQDSTVALYGSDDSATTVAHEVTGASPWHALVLQGATRFVQRIGMMFLLNRESGSPIFNWLSLEVQEQGGKAALRVFRRDGSAVEQILELDQNGHLCTAGTGGNLGTTVDRWGIVHTSGGMTIGDPRINSGPGSPEGAIVAAQGSLWMRTDGGPGETLYVKTSGSGNTGWTATP